MLVGPVSWCPAAAGGTVVVLDTVDLLDVVLGAVNGLDGLHGGGWWNVFGILGWSSGRLLGVLVASTLMKEERVEFQGFCWR